MVRVEPLLLMQAVRDLPDVSWADDDVATVIHVDVKFDRLPPNRVHLQLSGGAELGLEQVDMVRWATPATKDQAAGAASATVVVDGGLVTHIGEVVVERPTPDPDPKIASVVPLVGSARMSGSPAGARLRTPLRSFANGCRQVRAHDLSNPDLKMRARLFLTIELATYRWLPVDIAEANCTLRALSPALWLIPQSTVICAQKSLALGIADRVSGKSATRIEGSSELTEVMEFFQAVTRSRFGKEPGTGPVDLNGSEADALISDVACFASGAMAVKPVDGAGLFNFCANGPFFLCIPELALAAHGEYHQKMWLTWSRAAVLGAEILFDVMRRETTERGAYGYGSPFRDGSVPALAWSRAARARGVVAAKQWNRAELEQRLDRLLRGSYWQSRQSDVGTSLHHPGDDGG